MEYATQDSDPKLFEPYAQADPRPGRGVPQALVDAEPRQLDALIEFAARAYRRPLTERGAERAARALSQAARRRSCRTTRPCGSRWPACSSRRRSSTGSRRPAPGAEPAPVSDWELASRLSYFLWSSLPDDELRERGRRGPAARPRRARGPGPADAAATRSVRRLATEFACQWLHIYDFDTLDEKSERHFPDVRRPARRHVRGVDPVLHRPVPARRARCSTSSTPTTRSSTSRWRSTTAFPA